MKAEACHRRRAKIAAVTGMAVGAAEIAEAVVVIAAAAATAGIRQSEAEASARQWDRIGSANPLPR